MSLEGQVKMVSGTLSIASDSRRAKETIVIDNIHPLRYSN